MVRWLCSLAVKLVEICVDVAERRRMCNEQWYIEIEDKLNQLSVKDHSIR